ncbi:GNAT family N-acetyltransferase [Proteocatella sphenisci]|uniref:GNAT family N-acetyltransferase n=1 Tax=Proteocatella sphenisci TaxID=181070 RepID=UPI0004B05DC7|nr:GNAT family N-acetyltransferase [Proteocatella sphenisci]
MKEYSSIADIENCQIQDDIKKLLLLLERINPCGQMYYKLEDTVIVTYIHRLNLFNFKKGLKFSLPLRIVGLPVSIAMPGIFGDMSPALKILKSLSGLSLILNSDKKFINGGKTLSSFVFKNQFSDYDTYLNSLRSSYRRRIKIAQEKGKNLNIKRLENKDFSSNHYNLYKDVFDRSENKLEILPLEFFKEFSADLYEFKDHKDEVLAFVQILERKNELLFLFCGFKEEDVKNHDIYYNMLQFILKEGIRRGTDTINFGQTSEETKSKIGCIEEPKYLYLHHNNPLLGWALKKLTPYFSYKGYPNKHRVYKVNS